MDILQQNAEYLDLYGDSLLPYGQLSNNATFDCIIKVANSNSAIGYQHNIKVGNKCVIAERKFTWKGNVAKTAYLHIFFVTDFKEKIIIDHWREQKDKSFKKIK